MDVATGATKKITNKERFFSPDISHDGLKIIAVEMRTNQMSNLIVMDQVGQTIFRSKAARGIVYTHPKFSASDSFVYSPIRNEDGKMALLKLELATGRKNGCFRFQTVSSVSQPFRAIPYFLPVLTRAAMKRGLLSKVQKKSTV
jgi:hypothetical protein